MDDPSPDPIMWQMLLQLFLILTNAVFACAEIAVISLNSAKLEKLSEKGNRNAKRLLTLTKQPAKFLATIQVGITLAGFLGSAFAADNFSDKLIHVFLDLGVPLPEKVLDTIAVIIITLLLSYVTLVFGELVPKRIAMKKAEAIGLAMSGLVFVVSKLFAPIVWLLTFSTNTILRLLGFDPAADEENVTEEEIRIMVEEGSKKGAIDVEEKEFIHNLFEFDDLTAEKIMTHRTEVTMLWMEESDEEWEKTINESRYTIFPVCKDSPDHILGIINTKDYFRLKERSRENILNHALKPAQFIPESVRADVLLHNMKKNRNHFAIVVDEHGGMSGIVTINDLLEQLVGDLDDDIGAPEEGPVIEKLDFNAWRINGAAPLDEVAMELGITLPIEDYDTFAGMVFSLLGRIPDDGTTQLVEGYGLNIEITKIQGHRLEATIVRKIK